MKQPNSSSVSTRIAALVRMRRGTATLRQAANDAGLSAATMLRIEQGKMPDIITAIRLAEWCDVRTDELFGITPICGGLSASLIQNMRVTLRKTLDDLNVLASLEES